MENNIIYYRYKNLREKYDLTIKEIDEAVDFICGKNSIGDMVDTNLMLAIVDLLCNGDIRANE